MLPVEGNEVSSRGVRNSTGVNGVGRDSVVVEEEVLGDVGGENPRGYPVGAWVNFKAMSRVRSWTNLGSKDTSVCRRCLVSSGREEEARSSPPGGFIPG
jgi:hypothetical protein